MLIDISTRHGSLLPEQHAYLNEKAEKLLKYFARIMSIEVAVEHAKQGWQVEINLSAEHKHDFVAVEVGTTPEAAMDLCVQKIEHQLRRYKEKVQKHKGEPSMADVPRILAEQAEISPNRPPQAPPRSPGQEDQT